MMDVSRVNLDLLTERLDAEYYRPAFLENELRLRRLPRTRMLGEASRQIKLGYTGPIDGYYGQEGALFLTSKNIVEGRLVVNRDTQRIRSDVHKGILGSTVALSGDLLFSRTGSVGKATVLHDEADHYNFAAHLFAIRVKPEFDADFLAAFFNSGPGRLQSERMQRGTIIRGLSIYDMPGMIVPRHPLLVQRYIGDKTRQAEQLRVLANQLQNELKNLVQPLEIANALETPDAMSQRVPSSRISARLDSKFYRSRIFAVLDACEILGSTSIRKLSPSVTNGFESRRFVETGHAYITVSEVSSGRIELSDAPRIPVDVSIPCKALATRSCVLAVRGGSVGIAVKVHKDDEGAAISSDLIRLEFENEALAAAVAGFLGSPAGKELMVRASYGVVMPKLGQDDLVEIPIPDILIRNGRKILTILNAIEKAVRTSGKLVVAATCLVESLIEQRIMEKELSAAQSQLEQGDQSGDRAILSRLREGGIDAADTEPLFADLDGYYETLQLAGQAEAAGGKV